MQVLVCDNVSPKGVGTLEASPELQVIVVDGGLTDELLANAEAIVVRSATKITPEVMDKAPKLRAVGRAGVGVDAPLQRTEGGGVGEQQQQQQTLPPPHACGRSVARVDAAHTRRAGCGFATRART